MEEENKSSAALMIKWIKALLTGNLYTLTCEGLFFLVPVTRFWIYYTIVKLEDYPPYHCFETEYMGEVAARTVNAEQYTKKEAWKIAKAWFRTILPVDQYD